MASPLPAILRAAAVADIDASDDDDDDDDGRDGGGDGDSRSAVLQRYASISCGDDGSHGGSAAPVRREAAAGINLHATRAGAADVRRAVCAQVVSLDDDVMAAAMPHRRGGGGGTAGENGRSASAAAASALPARLWLLLRRTLGAIALACADGGDASAGSGVEGEAPLPAALLSAAAATAIDAVSRLRETVRRTASLVFAFRMFLFFLSI